MWTRALPGSTDLDRVLTVLRTLLTADAQFVAPGRSVDNTAAAAGSFTVDVVLGAVSVDEHHLPVLPPIGDPTWPDVMADMLAGAWFAHVQHVAELLEATVTELDRGRLLSASAAARTAVEMAARLHYGIQLLLGCTSDGDVAEVTAWLSSGAGRPPGDTAPTISARIRTLVDAVRAEAALPRGLADGLDGLYGRLCTLTHPGPEVWRAFIVSGTDGEAVWPTSEPFVGSDQLRAGGRSVLQGVGVAAAALRLDWTDMRTTVDALRARSLTGLASAYTLAGTHSVDLAVSYPGLEMQTVLARPLIRLAGGGASDTHALRACRPTAEVVRAAALEGPWSITADPERRSFGLAAARLMALDELLRSVTEHLNRGQCATAAAQARFVLEHMSSLDSAMTAQDPEARAQALATDSAKRMDVERLRQLLRETGMGAGARAPDGPIEQLKETMDAMVHADLVSRSLYWGTYSSRQLTLCRITGRPRFPDAGRAPDLSSPWVGTITAVVVADWFAYRIASRLLAALRAD
jgi:hypothetical protein